MISPRVLERRESGKTLSDSVTERSDDSSVTQDDPFGASFAVYPLHPSKVKERIVTGVFLAMHYTPHVDLAFNSVEHVMRDVEGGWLLRYMHANGATFTGYVLPWGQMSFWGATVITSLASAIPVVGDTIVTWLWGGFSVDNATLNRFFSLHHLLPFILVGASLLHLAALHQYGSNNPLGVHSEMDKIAFYPYFYVKDLVGWVAFAIFFSIWIFYAPNVLGHPDNYIPANPMPTPPHIVPEWGGTRSRARPLQDKTKSGLSSPGRTQRFEKQRARIRSSLVQSSCGLLKASTSLVILIQSGDTGLLMTGLGIRAFKRKSERGEDENERTEEAKKKEKPIGEFIPNGAHPGC
ncbi:hypothetical protein Q3G72_029640 [Acer saccharum]|nr:hypothetical protein Q3G72_021326 [Acer saccharum]KAK1592741.1 hypothetical protein Q3G72_029640 [Acer saccharum]